MYPFLDSPAPLALAHRGGALLPANHGIENTLVAFGHAVDLGYRYLETDVHVSRDGVVYAFHDADLTRMAGTASAFRDLDSAGIDDIRVGGREPVPRLVELLEAFPEARFNIDVKADDAVDPTLDVLRRTDALDRVCLASFSEDRLHRLRAAAPSVPTLPLPRRDHPVADRTAPAGPVVRGPPRRRVRSGAVPPSKNHRRDRGIRPARARPRPPRARVDDR